MSLDSAHQFNPIKCQADFTYRMGVKTIKIEDTGKGAKPVADDLIAVLRKIEHWHQGSIAGYRISYRDTAGLEHKVHWDGTEARISASS